MTERYTVEPGRNIYKDGKPFISINREGQTFPWEADDMCRHICLLLNAEQRQITFLQNLDSEHYRG